MSKEDLKYCEIERLRPTQLACGYQEVEAKQWEILNYKRNNLDNWLKKKPIPVVAGPDGKMYLIDRHHMGLALLRLADRWDWEHRSKGKTDNPYSSCYVKVIKDYTNTNIDKQTFFNALEQLGWLHPFDENGIRSSIDSIPRTLADLKDDPYRALAGFVRKAGGYKKSTIPYSEFKWADFFRDKINVNEVKNNIQNALANALDLCVSIEAKDLPGYTGIKPIGLDFIDSDEDNDFDIIKTLESINKSKKSNP